MPYDLIPRELEVLRAIGRAESDSAAANLLLVSPLTVQKHLTNVAAKMGITTREQALEQARREGLL